MTSNFLNTNAEYGWRIRSHSFITYPKDTVDSINRGRNFGQPISLPGEDRSTFPEESLLISLWQSVKYSRGMDSEDLTEQIMLSEWFRPPVVAIFLEWLPVSSPKRKLILPRPTGNDGVWRKSDQSRNHSITHSLSSGNEKCKEDAEREITDNYCILSICTGPLHRPQVGRNKQ